MSGEIQLLLTVDDKGSATVRTATDSMTNSINRAHAATSSWRSSFSGLGGTITSVLGRMFSLHNIITTLAGGAGLGLLAKKAIELGMQAEGAEVFREKVEGLAGAWSGFKGRLGEVIAQNPAIQDMLIGMTTKLGDWGKALIENKAVIADWFQAAQAAADGVGAAVEAATNRVRNAAKTVSQSMTTGGTGLIPGGYLPWGVPPEGAGELPGNMPVRPGSEAYWDQQYPARGGEAYWQGQVGSPISANFYGGYSRSDVQNIIAEMERSAYRDSGEPPDPGYY